MRSDEELVQEAMSEMEQGGGVVRLRYRAEQTLFEPGGEAGGTWWLKAGKIKLESVDPGGRVHFLHVMSGARVLGLGAYLLNRPFTYHARALTEVDSIWLDRSATQRFLEAHPGVSAGLMRQLGEELELLEARLRSAYSLDAPERIYETIVYLKKCDPCRIWSRSEIAEWAGTTPETAVRSIRMLREEGRIFTEGRRIALLRKRFPN